MIPVRYECLRCGRFWTHVEADACPDCFPVRAVAGNVTERDPVRQEPNGQLVLA